MSSTGAQQLGSWKRPSLAFLEWMAQLDPSNVAPGLVKLLQLVLEAHDSVFIFKEQARRLSDRMQGLRPFLEWLDASVKAAPHDKQRDKLMQFPLDQVFAVLSEAESLLGQVPKDESSFKRRAKELWHAKSLEEDFTKVNTDLSTVLQDINTCLSALHLENIRLVLDSLSCWKAQDEQDRLRDSQQLDAIHGIVANTDKNVQNLCKEMNSVSIGVTILVEGMERFYKQQDPKLPDLGIRNDQLTVFEDKVIDTGGTGATYHGKYQGCPVAVKTVANPAAVTDSERKQIYRAAYVMSKLSRCGPILRLYGLVVDPWKGKHHLALVTEYVGPSLGSVLRVQRDPMGLCECVANAVAIMHELDKDEGGPVVHGDLSLDSFAVANLGGVQILKLQDLESASMPTATYQKLLATNTFGSKKGQNFSYFAPEIWEQAERGAVKRTAQTDIYALGMLMYEICTLTSPFPDLKIANIKEATLRGERPSLTGLPDALAQVIRRCWANDPDQRPAARDVYKSLENLHGGRRI